jgi:hypothetical protein
VVLRVLDPFAHGVPHDVVCPSDEQRLAAGNDSLGDRDYLIRCLPEAEYHFGKSLPHRTVMIDPGEAQILERPVTELSEQPVVCVVGRNPTLADGVEEGSKLGWCHDAITLVSLTLPDPAI